MCVSVEVWRAKIGSFNARMSPGVCVLKCLRALNRGQLFLLLLYSAQVILALLVIGGMELNPGPNVYQCDLCEFSTTFTGQYVQHQIVHSQDAKYKFQCPLRSGLPCKRRFRSHAAFRGHVAIYHKHQDLPEECGQSVQCPLPACSLIFPTMKALVQHICEHLREQVNVKCPFAHCSRKTNLNSESAFRTHLSRYHKDWRNPVNVYKSPNAAAGASKVDSGSGDMDTQEPSAGDVNFGGSSSDDDSDFSADEDLYSRDLVEQYVAKFYMKLESKHHLPASVVQVISEDLAALAKISHHQIKQTLIKELTKRNIPQQEAKDIADISLAADTFFAVHHGNSADLLTTTYRRNVFYKDKFNYIEPESVFLGKNAHGKERFVHYIPLKNSLQTLSKEEAFKHQMDNSFERTKSRDEEDILRDFSDGSQYKVSATCKTKKSFDLFIFVDAFGVVNPLGSARATHKVVGVYFSLGNIEPKLRSQVDAMQLIMLFFEKDMVEFGQRACFGRLIEELKDLENEGVEFCSEKIPVNLCFLLGDNLGQHQIGGFQQNFRGTYNCRYCIMKHEDFLKNPSKWVELRTKADYDHAVEIVETTGVQDYEGIQFRSVFNDLKHFHVCGSQVPCAAHDLLEGIVARDMQCFIKYFIKKKWFTEENLNRNITQQLKGTGLSNLPAAVRKTSDRLRGHAAQNWTLLNLFPFLIGHYVQDVNDDVWRLYLKLKEICNIVFAPAIDQSQIAYLSVTIEEYLCEFQAAFEDINLLPKHHYLRHYPVLIQMLGPLVRLWTLRFESMHSVFKQFAISSKNFTHVTKTMIHKYQLLRAYTWTGSIFKDSIGFTSAKPLMKSLLDEIEASALDALSVSEHAEELKVVTVNGVTYKKNLWIVSGYSDYGLEIGCIRLIIHDLGEVVFVVEKRLAVHNSNFGVFELPKKQVQNTVVIGVRYTNLGDNFYPLKGYMFNGLLCFSLRNSVLGM